MECTKIPAGVRKAKKKQVKDELDRIKQAEKKKRRLEKALATSAAIRSELEKKKLKKKEEQERLDEEGAAIAEAVALHVLLGEDSDDSCKVMLKKDEELTTSLDNGTNFDFVIGGRYAMVPHDDLSNYLLEGSGWASDHRGYRCMWSHWDNSNLINPSGPVGRDFHPQYIEEERWDAADLSAGLLAAQAVSSLQITDDARVDAYVFNQMLRG